jgi:hypothetical protein
MSRRDDPPRQDRSLVHAETQRLPALAEPRRPIDSRLASGTPTEHLERIAMLERENAELRAELARLVEEAARQR